MFTLNQKLVVTLTFYWGSNPHDPANMARVATAHFANGLNPVHEKDLVLTGLLLLHGAHSGVVEALTGLRDIPVCRNAEILDEIQHVTERVYGSMFEANGGTQSEMADPMRVDVQIKSDSDSLLETGWWHRRRLDAQVVHGDSPYPAVAVVIAH